MRRLALIVLNMMLVTASLCQGQSLADAAREIHKQKAQEVTSPKAGRVITDDDLGAPADVTIQLVPGTTANGQGTLVAAGRGKHNYLVTNLDATRFSNGGVLHITITVGDGPSEASFDLYPQGMRLPTDGMPNSLASAHNVKSGAGAKIDYRFSHPGVFQLAAEGSWNAKAGETNTYGFVVEVANP